MENHAKERGTRKRKRKRRKEKIEERGERRKGRSEERKEGGGKEKDKLVCEAAILQCLNRFLGILGRKEREKDCV